MMYQLILNLNKHFFHSGISCLTTIRILTKLLMMNDIMECTIMKTLNTWLSKHLMAIIMDSTSRLRRNIPMPRQRGNGGGAAAVRGWSKIGGGGGGILAVAVAAWQVSQRC